MGGYVTVEQHAATLEFQRGGVSVRSQPWLHQNERARLGENVTATVSRLVFGSAHPEQIFAIEAIIAMDIMQKKQVDRQRLWHVVNATRYASSTAVAAQPQSRRSDY